VAEYLTEFNATQAAIRAGYSERSAYSSGARLLQHAEVARAVRAGIIERRERLALDADDVLLRALNIYDRAIQATPVTRWDATTKQRVDTGEFTYDGALAAKSLEMIGKLLGVFGREAGPATQRPFVIRICEEETQ
jgi:phage terminase small subunit